MNTLAKIFHSGLIVFMVVGFTAGAVIKYCSPAPKHVVLATSRSKPITAPTNAKDSLIAIVSKSKLKSPTEANLVLKWLSNHPKCSITSDYQEIHGRKMWGYFLQEHGNSMSVTIDGSGVIKVY